MCLVPGHHWTVKPVTAFLVSFFLLFPHQNSSTFQSPFLRSPPPISPCHPFTCTLVRPGFYLSKLQRRGRFSFHNLISLSSRSPLCPFVHSALSSLGIPCIFRTVPNRIQTSSGSCVSVFPSPSVTVTVTVTVTVKQKRENSPRGSFISVVYDTRTHT